VQCGVPHAAACALPGYHGVLQRALAAALTGSATGLPWGAQVMKEIHDKTEKRLQDYHRCQPGFSAVAAMDFAPAGR
jgi:hypothetical protein